MTWIRQPLVIFKDHLSGVSGTKSKVTKEKNKRFKLPAKIWINIYREDIYPKIDASGRNRFTMRLFRRGQVAGGVRHKFIVEPKPIFVP